MNYIKIILFLLFGISLNPYNAFAVIKTQSEAFQKQSTERDNSIKKFAKKHKSFIAKLKSGDFDLNHPVKKWLWLTLLFFLASVIFRAFGFGSFAYVLGAFALVCFIIWFLKFIGAL
jgi:hypothetical protein